ncbi:Aste57867_10203 [Aphanomyces stellatus]|uniref:Aste57867_10203 protein n=1 Tax=Aphanomyces stellatus TaxID=120398 RepID=A0A485KPR9_9STRA|nr:hypothetical protein As57867_010164 [Aphanomyces stellatus]VFT87079.1 Aste57867_10203 [Aphanomyces stellatus]
MHVKYYMVAEGKPLGVRASIADDTGADVVVLMDRPTMQESDGPVVGTWTIPSDGILRLNIDNRHALVRGRSIKFKLNVVDGN